jgi:nitroimidazol reductase NimA-like FMN-containing flavoprotein (pyridoxamine 5'-phosphate oxidase superfamily)
VRDDRPVVVPTLYARQGQRIVLHGSPVAGMFRDTRKRPEVCVTVTHLDALVLARSAFHHSANYRSVVIHGEAAEISDESEKFEALRILLEHIVPGRWNKVRPPSPAELRQTSVYAVSLEHASAKVRTGPPKDDDADLALPLWAGTLAFSLEPKQLVPDEHVGDGLAAPIELLATAQRSG